MNIREIVRLSQLGTSNVEISRLVGCHRETASKYKNWAESQGLLEGELPDEDELQRLLAETMPQSLPRQQQSSLEPHREQITGLVEKKVRMTAIQQRLEEQLGKPVSYWALRRMVRKIKAQDPEVVVRIETPPGDEGQVDFGYAGVTLDSEGQQRKTWLFVMVLSHSRHMYAELVYRQDVATWLGCHIRAFEHFGGVPQWVRLDNLKAGIRKHTWEKMEAQRAYRDLAEHYDFLVDPHAPRRPEHKGKVEKGGVDYICGTFLAGREPEPTAALNRKLQRWVLDVAGQREHGTTRQQPLAVFEAVEREALRPLPGRRFELPTYKRVKLQRDCHVHFEKAHYSAPYRLVGQELWVRAGLSELRIYTAEPRELVATHPRAKQPGQRMTNTDHLPSKKVAGLVLCRKTCRNQAEVIGPQTLAVVRAMLDHRPENRLSMAQRLLRLSSRYNPERLEAACARALAFGEPEYATVKRILERDLDRQTWPVAPSLPPARSLRFTRRATEYVISLAGLWIGGPAS